MREDSAIARPLFRLDPGWLFVVSGAALLACTALIPVQDDLALAHQARDRALALEAHRAQRLGNYASYLDALSRRDETLMKALAAGQLNLAPAGQRALVTSNELVTRSAGVFGDLEPEFEAPVVPPAPDSLLHRLTTNPTARAWVIVIGSVAVLYGLLPMGESRRRRGSVVVGHAAATPGHGPG